MDELMKQLDSKPSILVQPTPGWYYFTYIVYIKLHFVMITILIIYLLFYHRYLRKNQNE